MATISNLVVNFSARTATFERNVGRARKTVSNFRNSTISMNSSLGRMGTAVKAAIGAFAGFYAIRGVWRLSQALINAASDAEEIQSKFNVVFRGMAVDANEWSEKFGSSVGRARQDVKKWMAGLQDTFVPLGFAREKAFELSKTLVTLAVDVGSFNNQLDENVIRDMTSAIVGNHEAVRKYGIIITEAALKQEALRAGIDKSYKDLTNLEKVQLRYNMILAGTTDAQGDAIRTADSYANQVKRLQGNVTNLKEELGQALLPAATAGLQLLNEQFNRLEANGVNFSNVMVNSFEAIALGTVKVYGLLQDMNVLVKEMAIVFPAMIEANERLKTWNPLKWPKVIGEYPDEIIKVIEERTRLLDGLVAAMDKRDSAYDMSDSIRGVFDEYRERIANLRNITEEVGIGIANNLVNPIKEASKETEKWLKQMESAADRIRKMVETPAEKFQRQMAELREVFDAGQITANTYRRASDKYWTEWKGESPYKRQVELAKQVQKQREMAGSFYAKMGYGRFFEQHQPQMPQARIAALQTPKPRESLDKERNDHLASIENNISIMAQSFN